MRTQAIGAIARLQHKDGGELTINVEYNQLDPLLRSTVRGGSRARPWAGEREGCQVGTGEQLVKRWPVPLIPLSCFLYYPFPKHRCPLTAT